MGKYILMVQSNAVGGEDDAFNDWYDNVHRSTGFAEYRPKTAPLPSHLEPLLAECQPLYGRLAAHAITA